MQGQGQVQGQAQAQAQPSSSQEYTFQGLQKWSECVFEKFGWMLLASKYERKYKVDAYLEDIGQLSNALRERHNKTVGEDKKNDLSILIENVTTLQEHARKTFKPISSKNSAPPPPPPQAQAQAQAPQAQAKRQQASRR